MLTTLTVITRSRRAPAAAAAAIVVVLASFVTGPAAARSTSNLGFHPLSVTFVSAAQGWLLGTGRCGERVCLKEFETADGGASWSARTLPAALVEAGSLIAKSGNAEPVNGSLLEIRFADPSDGWIYGNAAEGSPMLWSTHDGGKIWRDTRPSWLDRNGTIFDLEAAAGRAYLLGSNDAGRVRLDGASVTEDHWGKLSTPPLLNPAGGGTQEGALVLQGRSGWLLEGNDRGPTGSARLDVSGRWVKWAPPCAAVGNSFTVPAAAGSSSLAAVCIMGGFAYPLSKAAPPGATIGSTWLYVSTNGGNTFVAGPELSRRPSYTGVIASPAPGVLLLGEPSGTREILAESLDGGGHWASVNHGNVLYLGFTTSTQGVAIVGASSGTPNATSLIMTHDGGRHWKQAGP
jgi:hypothetical protein